MPVSERCLNLCRPLSHRKYLYLTCSYQAVTDSGYRYFVVPRRRLQLTRTVSSALPIPSASAPRLPLRSGGQQLKVSTRSWAGPVLVLHHFYVQAIAAC